MLGEKSTYTELEVSGTPNKRNALKRQEMIWGYVFLLPTGIGFLLFIIGPVLASFGISLLKWDMLTPANFVGLQNYVTMSQDVRLKSIFGNTFLFLVGNVTVKIILSMCLALLLNRVLNPILRYVARTAVFFPVLVSVASVAAIWVFFLHKDLGVINYYLNLIGFPKISWLGSSLWSLRSIIVVDVWKEIGFYAMLFLAGLMNIPRSYYEAGEIDGGNNIQLLRHITLPLWTPTIFFGIVIALVDGFQVFSLPFLMTKGGPGDSSRMVVMYIYEMAFRSFRMGYSSSIAVILFLIIAILTIIQFRLSNRWVFYR